MTLVKLTFNKPAVRQFVEGEDKGLRIRIENGVVMFKTAKTPNADDATPFNHRTRGGIEATIEGSGVQDLRKALANPNGPFFVLKRSEDGWVAAHAHPSADAPPKFEPHVRVWDVEETVTETVTETSTTEPTKRRAGRPKGSKNKNPRIVPTKTVATKTPQTGSTKRGTNKVSKGTDNAPTGNRDYLGELLEAYKITSEPARPGRPTNDEREQRQRAKEMVANFETTARKIGLVPADAVVDYSGLIEAHRLIGNFLETVAAHSSTNENPSGSNGGINHTTDGDTKTRRALEKMGLADHDKNPAPRGRKRQPQDA